MYASWSVLYRFLVYAFLRSVWIEYYNRIKAIEMVWKILWLLSEINWLTKKFTKKPNIFSLVLTFFIGLPILMTHLCLHTGAVQFVNLSSFQAVAVQSRHCQFVYAKIQTSIEFHNIWKTSFEGKQLQLLYKIVETTFFCQWKMPSAHFKAVHRCSSESKVKAFYL